MPIDIKISDSDTKGFSEEAKRFLTESMLEYASDLIEETNRIEAGRNSTNGPPEITRGMVNDANILIRKGLGAPKKRWGLRILRIVSAVLALGVGFMYDENNLQNGLYMFLFIFLVSATILAVTISILKE